MPKNVDGAQVPIAPGHTRHRLATLRHWLVPVIALTVGVCPVAWADDVPCDCISCHTTSHGGGGWGCDACHGAPPATGSHAVHYGGQNPSMTYGDTGVQSTPTEYRFGCGNCHPLDNANHMNGSVQVELWNASSPAGSLKALNPPTAAYEGAGQTCADVYCHSGPTVSSGPVGSPLTYPPVPPPPGYLVNSTYIMDPTCSNLFYDPYTVSRGRAYLTTPAWGTSGSYTTCRECHQFPLTTSDPAVKAGVGDSHQWIDEFGYPNLHAYNMSYAPLACRTCHYATVTVAGTTQFPGDPYGPIEYGPVPLATRETHVNGRPDVAFDTVNPVQYRRTYSLAGASYDPPSKSCSNVACHYNPSGLSRRWQSTPRWGEPYRWWVDQECDLCHRSAVLEQTCTAP